MDEYTTSKEILNIDNDQLYDETTGQAINDIEDITEDQLKEILEGKKNESN